MTPAPTSAPAAAAPMLSRADLARLLNVTPTTVDRAVKAGTLPQPIRLSRRCLRWPRSVLSALPL